MGAMKATIIICTRNRADSLRPTLESLEFVDIPAGLSSEILVVDNGSTDGTAEVVQRRKVSRIPIRRVLEPKPGLSNARNAGISHAKGDIIIFTDDDLRFPKRWLETMFDPIIEKKGDAVAGSVELAPHLLRPWMTPLHRALLASSERLDASEPMMVGANMAFDRRVLDVVPSFDVELGAGALGLGEETLFALQLRKAGLKIYRATGSAVLHCFDEKRLARISWCRTAKNFGASNAYMDYHWRHLSISFPEVLLFRKIALYYLRRLFKWRECLSTEGAPEWELYCLEGIHRLVRYLVERKRPHNYDLEGLVKIRGVMVPLSTLPALEMSPTASVP
jgi:glycosyltransferase involved in cell wall biosynthesis